MDDMTMTHRHNKLHPVQVKKELLKGKTVEARTGWIMRINENDEVEIWPPSGEGFSTHLGRLDEEVRKFCKVADMPIPGVKETQGPAVKLPGAAELLGEDSSTRKPKNMDPSINDSTLGLDQKGTSAPSTSLGQDSSGKNPRNFSPAINKRPRTPEGRGGYPSTELGKDTSGNSTKWGRVRSRYAKEDPFDVTVQEEPGLNKGENPSDPSEVISSPKEEKTEKEGRRIAQEDYVARVKEALDNCLSKGKWRGSDEDEDLAGESAYSAYNAAKGGDWEDAEDFAFDAVAREEKEDSSARSMYGPLLDEIEDIRAEMEPSYVDKMKGLGWTPSKGQFRHSNRIRNTRIRDTFENKTPDSSYIYRELRRARPSENLLRDIMDPQKWAANNVFLDSRNAQEAEIEAVAPEGKGWEKTVKKMKDNPEIDNPWALAHWMKGEGYTPGGSKETKEKKKSSLKTAGPKLREKWTQDGGYGRDIEAESAEELHALTRAFGGDEVDWSPFKPKQTPEESADMTDDASQHEAQKKTAREEMPDFINMVYEELQEYLEGERGFAVNYKDTWDDLYEAAVSDWEEEYGSVEDEEDAEDFDKEGKKAEKSCPFDRKDKEAVDEPAKKYWSGYMGEYGKQLSKDDVTKKKPSDKSKKDKEDRAKKSSIYDEAGRKHRRAAWLRARKEAQAAPGAKPAPAPAAPSAPAAAPVPGAPASPGAIPETSGQPPKTPATAPKEGLPPGTGDAGLQALGWTAEDIGFMDDEDKKKILQIKLNKPGTKKPEKPSAEKPGVPTTPKTPTAPAQTPAPQPATPAAPAAPAPSPTKPVSPTTAARMAKLIQRKISRRKIFAQAAAPEQPAASPSTPSLQAPLPAAGAPTTPTTPKKQAPADSADADFAGGSGEKVEDSPEMKAFQILNEVQQTEVSASTPVQVTSIKSSELARRLLTELGVTAGEARDLFGVRSFSSLFK